MVEACLCEEVRFIILRRFVLIHVNYSSIRVILFIFVALLHNKGQFI